jgi:hypothetical protein
MKKLTILFVAVALLGLTGGLMAQAHVVTIQVQAIGQVAVDQDVTLTINTAVAGSEPTSDTDGTSALSWTVNGNTNRKITVKESGLPADVTLNVEAGTINKWGTGDPTGVVGGVDLTGTDQDFMTTVGKSRGNTDLNYTATATVDADVDDTDVTVTYTVTVHS